MDGSEEIHPFSCHYFSCCSNGAASGKELGCGNTTQHIIHLLVTILLVILSHHPRTNYDGPQGPFPAISVALQKGHDAQGIHGYNYNNGEALAGERLAFSKQNSTDSKEQVVGGQFHPSCPCTYRTLVPVYIQNG